MVREGVVCTYKGPCISLETRSYLRKCRATDEHQLPADIVRQPNSAYNDEFPDAECHALDDAFFQDLLHRLDH